ncbi:hypothetical protein MGYG_08015 [Nannizzia gypsea CBS 118893]|uniref:F-box domain-containing protein n=1 Tax=Arthroderma gypseum (strain ATCC MYA-4604 / CBS 118893) TaxID=535722 RepID=E4V4T8_ARTGP|nr:hypothetical protein MGYG_08015 [Nannizzia gypsea CBS 118893]EFR05012.1 hypothetical protein MGYG_08015 [Nannizzia gypsea CBS 118893]
MDPAARHSWNLLQYFLNRNVHNIRREAESHNAQHSHLFRLPAELLGIIHEYLTSEDSFALSLTCGRFYYSTIFVGVQRQLKSTKMGQFITLCMFEGLGELKEYCCRGCLTTHPSSHFSIDELEKRHVERRCLRTKKVVNAWPHEYSFNDIRRMSGHDKLGFILDIPLINLIISLFSSPKMSLISGYHLFSVYKDVSKEDFAELCRKLNIPLCNHMTSADERIADLYVPEYIRNRYPAENRKKYFERNKHGVKCNVCNTLVVTAISEPSGLNDHCVLIAIRPIGRLFSPLDPEWMAHASNFSPAIKEHVEALNRAVTEFANTDDARLSEVPPPDVAFNTQFVPLSLPKSTWLARLGVTAFSAISSWVPEHVHRDETGFTGAINTAGILNSAFQPIWELHRG